MRQPPVLRRGYGIISAFSQGLQSHMNICTALASERDIICNTTKSVAIIFWSEQYEKMFVEFVNDFTYLGHRTRERATNSDISTKDAKN